MATIRMIMPRDTISETKKATNSFASIESNYNAQHTDR